MKSVAGFELNFIGAFGFQSYPAVLKLEHKLYSHKQSRYVLFLCTLWVPFLDSLKKMATRRGEVHRIIVFILFAWQHHYYPISSSQSRFNSYKRASSLGEEAATRKQHPNP